MHTDDEFEFYSASSQADECRNYVRHEGSQNRDKAWILSPFDTWEANPYYNGPANPGHPEDDNGPIDLDDQTVGTWHPDDDEVAAPAGPEAITDDICF